MNAQLEQAKQDAMASCTRSEQLYRRGCITYGELLISYGQAINGFEETAFIIESNARPDLAAEIFATTLFGKP